MQHRKTGRKLGRNPKHQRALLRNLAIALILTERSEENYDSKEMAPKVRGRIITTVPKAKEVRPFVEKCITLGIKAQKSAAAARLLECKSARNTSEWKKWREGEGWREWVKAVAPSLACRRRAMQLLGSKEAVALLFDEIAPRFIDRPGGYTRIMMLATPRLGDGGKRAILEFVGKNDKKKTVSVIPSVE